MSIERYYLLILLLVPILFSFSIPSAFAQTVSLPVGSGVPGCEETNSCFLPFSISINVGDTVTWSNDDSAAHTVTSGSASGGPDGVFDSSLFMSGAKFSHTFSAAGEFPYFCMVHPWMTGTVIVQGASTPPPETEILVEEVLVEEVPIPTPPPIPTIPSIQSPTPVSTSRVSAVAGSSLLGCEVTNSCFLPYSVSINFGDTVTWSNDDSAAHTVTSGDLNVDIDDIGTVFDSRLFMAGTTFSWTAEAAGVYPYFCMIHPWMTGEVVVSGTPVSATPIPTPLPTPLPTPTDDAFPIEYVAIAIAIVAAAGIGIGLSKRKKVAPVISAPPAKAQAIRSRDDTQFWVCPNCGKDTQMKDGRQYCSSCKFYLSI